MSPFSTNCLSTLVIWCLTSWLYRTFSISHYDCLSSLTCLTYFANSEIIQEKNIKSKSPAAFRKSDAGVINAQFQFLKDEEIGPYSHSPMFHFPLTNFPRELLSFLITCLCFFHRVSIFHEFLLAGYLPRESLKFLGSFS